ncbi:membrane protein, partial [Peptococcaceae bacterium SCADC1_2_3]
PVGSLTKKYPLLKWPFLRGIVVLIESLIMGIEALTYSASQAMEEEEGEISSFALALTVLVALILAIFLFIVLPTGLTHYLVNQGWSSLAQNMVEGIIRLVVFLGYVVIISRMPDIKRVFQYHGAEHKVINAFEASEELVVSNVRRYSTFHPRCGTSFLLIVLVISIFLFSLLGQQVLWWRVVSRILLLPVLAGVSYELLKFTAKYPDFILCRLMMAPGRWLQGLTANEPDEAQIEVAISALQAVVGEVYV